MTFEADLRAHLLADSGIAAAVADQAANESRIYPVQRPANQKSLGAIVYTVIAGTNEAASLDDGDDTDAAGGVEQVRLQIDVYAKDHDAARELGRLVILRMGRIATDGSIRATRISRASVTDPDTREAREILDYSVWHSPQQ